MGNGDNATASSSADQGQLVVVKVSPLNAEADIRRLGAEITPASDFYVRSNFPVPSLDAQTHQVAVTGAVARTLSLTLADLHALGARTVVTTMECAGNNRMSLAPLPSGEPWQGGAVSTGEWTGAPLQAVLERAGLRPNAVEILVEGSDRGKPKDGPGDIPFARSLPLAKALHPDTLLAWQMNDRPIPKDHGAPLRLVVPAWYGMASVKWVRRIEALTEPFRGYYQVNRYIYDYGDGAPPVPVAEMRVKAIVTSPAEGETVAVGPCTVRGWAWSGEGQVTRVEVAVDGGDVWQEARLAGAPSPYAWQAWEWEWPAADPGRHAIRARATDSKGNQQPDAARWNKYGYGSNGVRPVAVNVREERAAMVSPGRRR